MEMLEMAREVARINNITLLEAQMWLQDQDEDMLVAYWDSPNFIAQCYPCNIENPDPMQELYY